MAADPRFAAWAAGQASEADLGPLHQQPSAVASRAIAERHELLRIASVRALELHAQIGHLDAQSLAAAEHYASQEPLQGPLGTGDPAEASA